MTVLIYVSIGVMLLLMVAALAVCGNYLLSQASYLWRWLKWIVLPRSKNNPGPPDWPC